jgi:monovalent cation/proton antiporter MnhG/PhaG subunit
VDVLVALGVTGELVCCLGLVVARDAFDRLHYVGAATTVPAFLLVAAVLVEESFTQPGLSALVTGLFLLLLNPVLVNATARAGRLSQTGSPDSKPSERREA